jgi:hypothetical protein
VVEVTRKPIFGTADQIEQALAQSATSTTVNTSFVERDNLAQRGHNRRLTRKTTGFSKELDCCDFELSSAAGRLLSEQEVEKFVYLKPLR